jgi:hypothetical protein
MTKTAHTELKAAHAATIANLTEVTNDPIDAMKLAADLFAMSAYRAERAVAIEAGAPEPRSPKPRSKYLRLFTTDLGVRLNAIAGSLDTNDLDRLKKHAPALARRLERGDLDLAEQIYGLVCMESHEAATWIREHLGEIEARFAS